MYILREWDLSLNVTSKLRRSKVLDGGEHRVLTVSVLPLLSKKFYDSGPFNNWIQIHSSICGDHQTSLKLSYVYSLASGQSSKKKRLQPFEYFLAPGSLVGAIKVEISFPKFSSFRHNFRQALSPSCQTTKHHDEIKNSFKRRTDCSKKISNSVFKKFENENDLTLQIYLLFGLWRANMVHQWPQSFLNLLI